MTLHIHTVEKSGKHKPVDLLVIPFCKGAQAPECVSKLEGPSPLQDAAVANDFSADEGAVLLLYPRGAESTRIALLGLGHRDSVTTEVLRRCYGALMTACRDKAMARRRLLMPTKLPLEVEDSVRGVCEGLLLSHYAFNALKRTSLKTPSVPPTLEIALVGAGAGAEQIVNECTCVAESVYFARDLVNGNADDVTPQFLAAVAKGLAKELPRTRVTVFDKKAIEKHKMGLLLAVNRGSPRDPVFIILSYRGQPRSQDHTVVVGKGITFDTGGLNLKATGLMEEMKNDMAGAAAALGTVRAAAQLRLPVNLTAVIPSTENCIGGRSYKPGDVYLSYSGHSVEVGNTDAEGRLILADALAYARDHLKPTRMINLATLTGSVIIALGHEITGLMSNDDELAAALESAGQISYERVWRLPLVEEYRRKLNSDIADIKNIGGRPGGLILSGLFLREFVGDVPWAHLDIAGTAYHQDAGSYQPKLATGVGVRLMIEFLKAMR